ncbi:MAG: hypothetical protein NUV83_00970 [Candidatus Wolfebacteria bacterium]|nr:hypothetical protein [Candidatus Wolfebacteria bacterium]
MKQAEKQKARELRAYGYSLNEIAKNLNVSKSSASLWVRNIALTKDQEKTLSKRAVKLSVVEKRRATRLARETATRENLIDQAQKQVKKITRSELWLIGSVLYWAGCGKTQKGLVRFSNSDPNIVRLMMAFFRDVCEVPEQKFRGHIYIYPHLDHRGTEKYWSEISGIPLKQFFKLSVKRATKSKKEGLPYGTFEIYICNVGLSLKIRGWAKGIFASY